MSKPFARLTLALLMGSVFVLGGEDGRFLLHKSMKPVGEESYVLEREASGKAIRSDFQFKDRGQQVSLKARMSLRVDGTVLRLELKGNTARYNAIDLEVDGTHVPMRITENGATRAYTGPSGIGIGSYAPIAFQQEMVRQWLQKGRPQVLPTVPIGPVKIRQSGMDRIEVQGHVERLTRFLVSDLSWGQECLWLDRKGRLVALVGIDSEFDSLEATRAEYEGALRDFIRISAREQMRSLNRKIRKSASGLSEAIAVVGATLIDGQGGLPVADSTLVAQGGRIVACGPRAQVKVPQGARILHAEGKTLMPGLWDMHAHCSQVEWGPVYLASGVTTVRDMGETPEYILSVRQALRAGEGVGPRLFISGFLDGAGEKSLGLEVAATPAEAAGAVRRFKADGFDQTKIYSSLRRDCLEAAITTSHGLGLRAVGHLPDGIDVQDAMRLGMDEFSHIERIATGFFPQGSILKGEPLPPLDLDSPRVIETLKAMAANHVVLDPTMVVYEWLTSTPARPVSKLEPGLASIPSCMAGNFVVPEASPLQAELLERKWAAYMQILKAIHRAGIPVVAGTDQSVPGHSLHRELEIYVEAGFTPMEAIQAATCLPAKVMGHLGDSGTLESGKRADFVLLNGNPLEDIRNTRSILAVFQGGVRFDPATLWRAVGFGLPSSVPVFSSSRAK